MDYSTPFTRATQFLASISDPRNSALSINWIISGSENIQGNNDELFSWTWFPPGLPGLYLLTVRATNSFGLSAEASRTINFEGAAPWPSEGRDLQRTRRSPIDTSQNQGRVRWYSADDIDDGVPGRFFGSSPVIGPDGVIYTASMGWDYMWLSTFHQNGVNKWKLTNGGLPTLIPGHAGHTYSSPTIGADGTAYVAASSSDGVFLLAMDQDGTQQWITGDPDNASTLPGYDNYSSPTIGADGTIYIGSSGGGAYLTALDSDGEIKWTTEGENSLPGIMVRSSPAIDADGTIYIGSHDDDNVYLTAFTPNGKLKWSTDSLPGDEIHSSPAIGVDGTIYIGSSGGGAFLTAINPDRTIKWTTTADNALPGDKVHSSPAIGSNQTIYIGSHDDGGAFLTAINRLGVKEWSTEDGDPLLGNTVPSSPAIGAEGTIHIGSFDSVNDFVYVSAFNPDDARVS